MNKKQRIIGILVIGVILLGVMFFQNIKIYGKQFWYPTKQYLAINKNDDIQLSLVFVDGKRKAEEVEASLGTIAFLDENGKQYKSKNQKLKVLESNKVYGVYQIDLQLDKMEIGEYVLNQLICNGKEYEIGSIVLDVMDGMEDYEFELEPGDVLFLYTDGVPEATDAQGNMFGMQNLLEILNRTSQDSAGALLEAVRTDVADYVGNAPQFDDLTMLAIKRT